jgi:FkbM family methyltransferase
MFLDVGAHIGSVVADVRFHCPEALVMAFEAIPEKVAHLRKIFPGVEVLGVALGDRSGEATFSVMSGKNSGYSSLGKPRAPGKTIAIQVPIRRLDDIVSGALVDVVKIDVEGAELGVLQGAERVVRETRPTIAFESGPEADDGLAYSKRDLWRWFTDRSYAVLVPNRLAHEDPGLGLEGFLESHLYPRRTTNYFGVPTERRHEIRGRARRILKLED